MSSRSVPPTSRPTSSATNAAAFHEIRTFAHLASAWGVVAGPRPGVRLRFRSDVAHSVRARHHRNLRIDGTNDGGDLLVTFTAGQDKYGIPIDPLAVSV